MIPTGAPEFTSPTPPESASEALTAQEIEPEIGDVEPKEETSGSAPTAALRIAQESGVVMLIGATDTGKTTLCSAAVKAALALGKRVAVVDADSGQSEIGPPATLGLGLPDESFTRLSDLKPRGLAFIGSITPNSYLLEWAIGTRRLVDRARELGAEIILVDTPGLVTGAIGRRLQGAIAESILPTACVLLERNRELRILERALPPCHIVRPGVSPAAHSKTPTVRALRRSAKWSHYFQDAVEGEITVDRKFLTGGTLFLGHPIRAAALGELQKSVSVRLLHIERDDEGTRVLTAGTPSEADRAALTERFKGKLQILEASRLKHLVLGLLDEAGEAVALGSLQRVDFRRRMLKIATPWLDLHSIRGIAWGTARVSPDGKERESLRRGEL